MIEVRYEEETQNDSTGAIGHTVLGLEMHKDIEEVLLPLHPSGGPIFFTKKFSSRPEYRWEVREVIQEQREDTQIYVVRLIKRVQVEKEFYLKNIAGKRGTGLRSVLYPWAIVEVEFGHSPMIGKMSGDLASNKRYVDTVQMYSMPKRRLAVVVQIIKRQHEDLLQVIPISSIEPVATEKASVEITSQLTKMANYRERSWAICRMIQTVTASRVMAPLVQRDRMPVIRDKGFRTMVRDPVRSELKDALLYGIAAEGRLTDLNALAAERLLTAKYVTAIRELESCLANYKRFADVSGYTYEQIQELLMSDSSP